MRKPDSLKDLLKLTVPDLKDNPEQLALFIDKGTIVGGGGLSLSFEYRYSVNLVFEGFSRAIGTDAIIVPILAWLAENQPELLNKPGAEPFSFDAELLDDDRMDISITLDLTEAVIVTPREGGYNVSHPVEPTRQEFDRFEGVPNVVKLWQLFFRNDLVDQTTDPAFHP